MMSQKMYQCFKANLCYMLKNSLFKIYTGTLIVPPSFDTVHHFLSQITNFVVTLCSTKVYTGILLFCLACTTLHVDINRGVTEFDTHLILYLSCIVVSICIHV
jgi:hypothetical protein